MPGTALGTSARFVLARPGLTRLFFFYLFIDKTVMLDPNQLRKDLPAVVGALARRGVEFDAERFNQLEARRKSVQVETESLQARRNAVSKLIGQLQSKGQDASGEMAESQAIPVRLKQLEIALEIGRASCRERVCQSV